MSWRSRSIQCGRLLGLLAVALSIAVVAGACAGSPSSVSTPSSSPSLPQVVATVSAATPGSAFSQYVSSHIGRPPLPNGTWRSHRFGPASPDSATFELTVRFTFGDPLRKADSWATYSVTRTRLGQPWTIARISPPLERVLPAPLRTPGP